MFVILIIKYTYSFYYLVNTIHYAKTVSNVPSLFPKKVRQQSSNIRTEDTINVVHGTEITANLISMSELFCVYECCAPPRIQKHVLSWSTVSRCPASECPRATLRLERGRHTQDESTGAQDSSHGEKDVTSEHTHTFLIERLLDSFGELCWKNRDLGKLEKL